MTTFKASDNSVRDHAQSARIYGEKIEVTSKVGRAVTNRYWFLVSDWIKLNRHPNPFWARRDYIGRLTEKLDFQSGGPEQAERIRDSQIRAIEKAFSQIPT